MIRVENLARAERVVRAAFDGADIEVWAPGGEGPDLLVRVGDRSPIALEVKWAGEGYPADVRRILERSATFSPRDQLVIVAREFSPGALELLADADVNWADETGWARIVGPGGLVVIRHQARRERSRADRFSWSPAALSIAEGLLELPDAPLRVALLGERLGWSTAQVANVLGKFDAQGWTAKRGPSRGPSAYRELVDRDGLLVAWSDGIAARPVDALWAHRPLRDPVEFLRSSFAPAAAAANVQWAVSGWTGVEMAAPFTTTVPTVQLYVESDRFGAALPGLLRAVSLQETEEGAGSVELRRADRDVFLWVVPHEGLPVVGPARLFSDLRPMGGRGLDVAGHVLEELIQGGRR